MALTYPADYFDRTDASKRFDAHLFLANRVLQSAELNELQAEMRARVRGIGDALFAEGAVIKDAQISIDPDSGVTQCQSGIVYMNGKAYGVPSASITIPLSGTVSVGIYLINTIITPLDDSSLRDPAVNSTNFQEPGADRLKVLPTWGSSASAPAGDSNDYNYYPIYTVIDGVLQPYHKPPDLTPIALALARYDVQSTGSNYVSSGFDVQQLPDVGDQQQFMLTEGVARINGIELDIPHSTRTFYSAVPDLASVSAESHLASASPQIVTLNHAPLDAVIIILITRTITLENVVRGVTPGGLDSLAHNSVIQLTLVKQGATTYAAGTDYTLSGDQISWAPGGAEPAGGSTYQVTYTYTAVYPNEPTILGTTSATSVQIIGATTGSNILIGYTWRMPRYDRMCIDSDGVITFVRGVSQTSLPVPPPVPNNLLPLATILQTWDSATRTCTPDAVRMVSMAELRSFSRRLDDLYALVGDWRLAIATNATDPATKRGLFVDSFANDNMRDIGLPQTAITNNDALTLGVDWTVHDISLSNVNTLDTAAPAVILAQGLATDSTAINPYMAFAPIPAEAVLEPAIDFWTETHDVWGTQIVKRNGWNGGAAASIAQAALSAWTDRGAVTSTYRVGAGGGPNNSLVTAEIITDVVSDSGAQYAAEYLRPLTVHFTLSNWGNLETLTQVLFDGLTVTPRATP